MVVGAYRCPVCGIDFPSGTRGAPRAAGSPGEVDLSGTGSGGRIEPSDFASALDNALGLRPGRSEPESEPDAAPEPGTAGSDEAEAEDVEAEEVDAEAVEVVDAAPDEAADLRPGAQRHRSTGAASLDVRPSSAGGGYGAGGTSALSVRPGREGSSIIVHHDEERALTVRPRRSVARGIAGTLVSALLLIAAVGAGVWWTGRGVELPSAIGLGQAEAITVEATDGWTALPSYESGMMVMADGPFRLRVAGKVYTLEGGRPVRVPPATDAAIRIVRSPTVARVEPAQ